jgi:hypothetical protein
MATNSLKSSEKAKAAGQPLHTPQTTVAEYMLPLCDPSRARAIAANRYTCSAAAIPSASASSRAAPRC